MNDRFRQWLALQEDFDRHSENASAALDAIDGKDTIVNRHLLEIARREGDLADFALVISESPVFDHLFDEGA